MKSKIRLREPARIAAQTIRGHKLRSALTLLGIILSVSTLIAVVSLIQGTNRYIEERVANLGSSVFLVMQYPIITDAQELAKAVRRNPKVTWDDFEFLRDNLKSARQVGVEVRRNAKVRSEQQTLEDVNVRGVTANIGEMDLEEPEFGRYISDSDDYHRAETAFIGAEVAAKLFPTVDPLGRAIRVDGDTYVVVGVAKKIGSVMGQSQDSFVYVPVRTYIKHYGSNQSLSINVQAINTDAIPEAQDEAKFLMRVRRHLDRNEQDNFGVIGASSLMDLWHNATGAIASTMVGIVSVFLVIGGIVIMNVMLTSVTERTREIGIRKSLGATRQDILLQFLVESAVLAAIGGAVGVLLAAILDVLLGAFTSVPVSFPVSAVLLALVVSTAIGLFFGVYPAWKASMLDPIEALRCE